MMDKFFIRMFLLFSFILFPSCNINSPINDEHTDIHIIVPLYSFPTDENGRIWNAVFNASEDVPIDVIWGVIDTLDEAIYRTYTDWLKTAKNINLYSYVATTSGEREIDDVKNEIDYFVENFNIDGIFFDEVSGDSQFIPYYRQIVEYAKQYPEIKKVILNSSYAPVDFLDKTGADILIIFENYGIDWYNFTPEDYLPLSKEKKAVIISNVYSITQMQEIVNDAIENDIGHIFVTDKEYDFLPSYWVDEVNLIKGINQNN